MKRTLSLILISLTVGFSAWAAPAPLALSGAYVFKGELEMAPTTDNRIVYAFTDQGKADLIQLQASGYGCEAKPSQTYLCKKNTTETQLPEDVKTRFVAQAQALSISFLNHAPEAPDTLENDSESLKEWQIMQKVQIGDSYWPSYRYQILEAQIHKVILGEGGETETIYFSVNSSQELGYYININQSNPHGFRQYRVFAKLSNR
jgi:hypothetical protein